MATSSWAVLVAAMGLMATMSFAAPDVPGANLPESSFLLKGMEANTGPALRAIESWELGGSASIVNIKQRETWAVARLTPDEQGKRGWMFTREPLRTLGRDWEIDVEYRVHGKGMTYFGDGFAMWYTPERYVSGSAFGHATAFVGLGVFVDTYDNDQGAHAHKHPWVSAVVGTPVSPGLFDHNDAGGAGQRYGCHTRAREFGQEKKFGALRIRYKNNILTVKTVFAKVPGDFQNRFPYEWSECVNIQNVDIPPGYFLGFSASTGDLSDNHDIVSVRVRGEVGAKPEEPPKPASDGDAPQVGEQPELPTPGVEEQKEGDTNEDAVTPPVVEASPRTTTTTTSPPAGKPVSEPEPQPDSEPVPVPAPSVRDLAEIDEVLKSTPVVADLDHRSNLLQDKLDGLHERLEREVARVKESLEVMVQDLENTEASLEKRLKVVEARVKDRVQDLVTKHEERSRSWLVPFVLLTVVVVAGGGYAYIQHRKLLKTHIL